MTARIITGDCLAAMRDMDPASVQCCVTSPPYYLLRNYGVDLQIGLEATPEAYTAALVDVFREVRRVLRDDGTLWLNLGDSYAASSNTGGTKSIQGSAKRIGAMTDMGHKIPPGLKPKDLVGIPWRVAFALQADGWYLRSEIIWHKPNPMPESVNDRPTKSHEQLFLLAKNARYYYDKDAIAEDAAQPDRTRADKIGGANGHTVRHSEGSVMGASVTRNKRDVWTVPTHPYPEAHFATYPPDLIRPCIRAGCPVGGVVLDPFAGAGTTGVVCVEEDRHFVGIELNPEYADMARARIEAVAARPRQEELNF